MTGAGGQLGRAFGKLLPHATLLDRAALDVTDRDAVAAVVKERRPEVIIHCAAYTKVDDAELDPDGALRVNVDGTKAVADAANGVDADLVYLSTDYVFDGKKEGAYTEGDAPNPLSVYGKSKLDGEAAAAHVERHLIVRTSWIFGGGDNFVSRILAAAMENDELAVIDDQTSLPTYAPDLVAQIRRLIDEGAAGIIHVAGGGEPATRADEAEAALVLWGSKTQVRRVSSTEYYAGRRGPVAPRPVNSVLDCSKASSMGVALRPWREGLAEYVRTLR